MGQIAVVCSIKDEGPYLLEWIAFQRVIGFERIIVAANDCSDGSVALLCALADAGEITFLETFPQNGQAPQHVAYRLLQQQGFYAGIDWLAVLDVDEFLNIAIGAGRVQDLLALAGDVDLVQMNWATFGTGALGEDLVLRRFQARVALNDPVNYCCKCLIHQPQRFALLSNHTPKGFGADSGLRILDGAGGRRVLAPQTLPDRGLSPACHGIAQVNHYAVKSPAEYALRQRRGQGARRLGGTPEKPRHDASYFAKRAKGEIADTTILRHLPALAAEMARLAALPGVAAAEARLRQAWAAALAGLAPVQTPPSTGWTGRFWQRLRAR